MSPRRPYNHCRYAGNIGDVWKHFLLLELLSYAASKNDKSFQYIESHGGPGYSRLGANGDWQRGIGRVLALPSLSFHHQYFDLILPKMEENQLYKGSWVLACEFLKQLKIPNFRVTIHELSAETLKMAGSTIRKANLAEHVRLEPKNGFEAVKRIESMDFVFLDPPYQTNEGITEDWDKIESTFDSLKDRTKNWLIWYPIFRSHEPDKLVQFTGGTSFELNWSPAAPGWIMKGCGMLMDVDSACWLEKKMNLLQSMASILGGEISINRSTVSAKPPQKLSGTFDHIRTDATQPHFLSKPV